MRLLGLDLETTGFDTANDRVTEIGLAIWDVAEKRPLVTFGSYFIDDGIREKLTPEVVAMMERVCKIKPEHLEEFGTPPKDNYVWLESFCKKHKIDYIVGHNGENFDRPLLYAELTRLGVDAPGLRGLPWIDTRTDIPFATEPDSRKLKHLALDSGFINPFAHRAVFDVLTMLMVLSNYDIEKVLEYQKIPFVTVQALVSYDDRQLAKDQRYSWEKLGERTFPKKWVKRIKLNQLEAEMKACKFKIAQLE